MKQLFLALPTAHCLLAAGLVIQVVGPPPGRGAMKNIGVTVLGYGVCTTGTNGDCTAQVPDKLSPGSFLRISVQPDTWVISNLPGGAAEYPKSRVIRLELVRKGTDASLNDDRLRWLLRETFQSSALHPGPPGSNSSSESVEEWLVLVAREVGLPPDTVKLRLDEFVQRKAKAGDSDAVLAALYQANYKDAVALAEARVQQRQAEFAKDSLMLGYARLALLDYKKAGAAYSSALVVAPDSPDLLSALGMLCFMQETGAVSSEKQFKCESPANEYWERSLTQYQKQRPFDLLYQAFITNNLAAFYHDHSAKKETVDRIAATALQIRSRADQLDSPSRDRVHLLTALTLVAIRSPQAGPEVDKMLSAPDGGDPIFKTLLLQTAAVQSFSRSTVTGVREGMARFDDAAKICPRTTHALQCRLLHITAASLALRARGHIVSLDLATRPPTSELDSAIEKHILQELQLESENGTKKDAMGVAARFAYALFLNALNRYKEALTQCEAAFSDAQTVGFDLTGSAMLLIYPEVLENRASEVAAAEALDLRRRSVEIARLTQDETVIRDSIDAYAKTLELAGRKSEADETRKQLPAPPH